MRFAAPELIVTATARRRVVACPKCGHASTRVHSRYRRTLADLPWHGLRVRLAVHVRRFFCDVPGCKRRIFTERLPKTAVPYARRTARAASALEAIGLALGGRAGARLAAALGLAGAPSEILSILSAIHSAADDCISDGSSDGSDHARAVPRVLGVDDWAWRKGQRYGTILVDLEQHRVIDLLPDREPDTLVAWLCSHRGVEFISRDRAGGYADAARRGAPEAIQIADRFHLLRNLTDAAQHALERHHTIVRAIGLDAKPPTPVLLKRGGPVSRRGTTTPADPPLAEQRKLARRARRQSRYNEMIALRTAGASVAAIHRDLGLSRKTIMRWLGAGAFPERQSAVRRQTSLTPHAEYLAERWRGGCHNVTELWREIRDGRGFHGGLTTVLAWARLHLRGMVIPKISEASLAIPARPTSRPSSRRAAWLLTAPSEQLKAPELRYVEAICAASNALASVHGLAVEFRRMLNAHDPNALAPWLDQAERSELQSLGSGLRRDKDAVLAAILFPWSNGQVEGQVNRLKLIKRTMYGRAGFALLRRRVLAA
ncbi:MAG: ISL3 family transposase [Gemmatimonadaceae bacterium]